MTASSYAQATPGTLAEVPAPAGWQWHYAEQQDAAVMVLPNRAEITVSTTLPGDPARLLRALLTALPGGTQYAPLVEVVPDGDRPAAEIRITDVTPREWIRVVTAGSLSAVVRARTVAALEELVPHVERLSTGVRVREPAWPPLVVGRYQIGSSSSSDYGGDAIFAQDYVTLHPGGAAETSVDIGGGGQLGTVVGRGASAARWEVRGSRLLFFEGPEAMTNFHCAAFRNGLELIAPDGRRVNAVRLG